VRADGYPIEDATHVALSAVKEFLSGPQGKTVRRLMSLLSASETADRPRALPRSTQLEKVIFCVFSDKDKAVYEKIWPTYFS
jgi:O-acetyl-ADP-ribose deacetylase (regulator of RNase III)